MGEQCGLEALPSWKGGLRSVLLLEQSLSSDKIKETVSCLRIYLCLLLLHQTCESSKDA